MKKILSTLLVVALVFIVLRLPESVSAKTPTSATNESSVVVEEATAGAEGVIEEQEYVLPYPGMLPDNPLYILKQIRDWILDKLIVDPLRRAEFNLLQADKRLGMSLMLTEKGKEELAEEVVSKGEKYLNSAVYGLVALKNEGQEVPAYLVERLTRAIDKHREVLSSLTAKSTEAVRNGFQGSLNLVTALEQELEKLR